MDKKGSGRGLEEISNIFLSTKENANENSHQAEDQCEIQETVTVRKKLAFYNDENVQKNMARSLSKHIEKGYNIRRIYLQKNEDISTPGSRIHRKENVIISIKPSSWFFMVLIDSYFLYKIRRTTIFLCFCFEIDNPDKRNGYKRQGRPWPCLLSFYLKNE